MPLGYSQRSKRIWWFLLPTKKKNDWFTCVKSQNWKHRVCPNLSTIDIFGNVSLIYSFIFSNLWAQDPCMWRLKNTVPHMRKEWSKEPVWPSLSQGIYDEQSFSSDEFALTAIFSCPCLLHAKCYPWFYLSAMRSTPGIKRKTGLQHDILLVLALLLCRGKMFPF